MKKNNNKYGIMVRKALGISFLLHPNFQTLARVWGGAANALK